MNDSARAAEQAMAQAVDDQANGTGAWGGEDEKSFHLSDEDWKRDMGQYLTSGNPDRFRQAAEHALHWDDQVSAPRTYPSTRIRSVEVLATLGQLVVNSLKSEGITAEMLEVKS